MARPPAADEPRERHLGIRLTAAESAEIAAAATRAGSPASVWVRDTALAAASTRPRLATPARRERAEAVHRLAVAVRRVGTNINQLTRRVHLAPADVAKVLADSEVLPVFVETRDVLRQVLGQLEDLRPALRREVRR